MADRHGILCVVLWWAGARLGWASAALGAREAAVTAPPPRQDQELIRDLYSRDLARAMRLRGTAAMHD